MDEIEQSAGDPRDEFHHNYLTDADRKRAEIRRRLDFPGLYSSPENEETVQSGTSGLTKSGVSKFREKNLQTKETETEIETVEVPSANNVAKVHLNHNANNNRSLTYSPNDGYVYDDDYRETNESNHDGPASQCEIDTVETTVSARTVRKRIRASSPSSGKRSNKIQRTKDWLKRGRKQYKRKPSLDDLLASSFRSDNASCPGKLGFVNQ